ncbi:MAG: lipopolysaccharide heptosyltransferase II [Sporomusaceae bacterium]|nr:lipopolysaccharide heptosyltransferase II [Sporomusaceae bacterium]
MISMPNQAQRILVINLAFIGDVLLSSPLITVLHEAYPAAQIDCMVIPLTEPIASRHPYVTETLVYDKRGKHKAWRELMKLIQTVKSRHYDLAISTNFAARGAMLAWAARIPQRIGYDAQHAGVFLTQTVSAQRPLVRHETENYLDLLQPLGISAPKAPLDTALKLAVRPEDRASLAEKYPDLFSATSKRVKPIIALCPVGSYARKSWDEAGYLSVIADLAKDHEVLLLGGHKEAPALAALVAASDHKALALAGTLSLGELAALLEQCQLLITVDTGPLHLAQAVGTPVLALFGPTDPAIWGPRGPRDRVFYRHEDCSPCWGKGDCREQQCMKHDAAAVIAAAREQLRNGATL